MNPEKISVETKDKPQEKAPTPPYPPDKTIRVGNIQARYWSDGSMGTPVILIHGIGGYVETWWPNLATLAREHRVYAVDLPGFGRTDKPGDGAYDMQFFLQFMLGFMEALSLEHASLVGHSLGGWVALNFTLTYPQMVDRLVLMSSAGLGREVCLELRLASLPLLGEIFTRPSLSASRTFATSIVYDPSLIIDQDVKYDYEMAVQPGAQQAFLKTLRALCNVFGQKQSMVAPILNKLPTITQPTLVLWGRDDTIIPVKHSEAARKIPNARVQIIDRCNHIPQFEHPQTFDTAVQEFLCD